MFKRFVKDDSGAALVEYGMLVGFIAVLCIVAVQTLGTTINTVFTNINTALAPLLGKAAAYACGMAGSVKKSRPYSRQKTIVTAILPLNDLAALFSSTSISPPYSDFLLNNEVLI